MRCDSQLQFAIKTYNLSKKSKYRDRVSLIIELNTQCGVPRQPFCKNVNDFDHFRF